MASFCWSRSTKEGNAVLVSRSLFAPSTGDRAKALHILLLILYDLNAKGTLLCLNARVEPFWSSERLDKDHEMGIGFLPLIACFQAVVTYLWYPLDHFILWRPQPLIYLPNRVLSVTWLVCLHESKVHVR